MRGIGLMITDYQFYWPSELKISEILFGHTDYQRVKGGGLSISINRTLRNIQKSVFEGKKLRRGVGNLLKFFHGLQSVAVIGGPLDPTPLPPSWCQ